MYFSNLVGEIKGTIRRNEGHSARITFTGDESVSNKSVYFISNDNGEKELIVSGNDYSDIGRDIFKLPNAGKDLLVKNEQFSYFNVRDTEENPLIVVATKGICFYNNTPTYINVLFVNSNIMLVELVFGICQFVFDDGRKITLQRCNDEDLNSKTIYDNKNKKGYIDCDSLQEMVYFKTKKGYDKTYETVCPLYIRANRVTRGTEQYDSVSVKFLVDNAIVFDPDRIKEVEEEELRREEEEKRIAEMKKLQSEKRQLEAIAERNKEETERIEQRKKEQADRASKRASKLLEEQNSTSKRNSGAANFLAMLNNM